MDIVCPFLSESVEFFPGQITTIDRAKNNRSTCTHEKTLIYMLYALY